MDSSDVLKLTALVKAGGCGSKFGPGDLRSILEGLHAGNDPRLLYGTGRGDDAAVFRLSDEIAIIQTVDFFTPIVDDPFTFGEIAAANALSDCYALGARPITAMNIAVFPAAIEQAVLRAILEGGAAKVHEAGATLVGGHTIGGPEPIYGLSVTGTAHPLAVVTNSKARTGDVLVLTKKIGVGIVSNALKSETNRNRVSPRLAEEAVRSMRTLNRAAAEAMVAVGVNACTDITGFGLLGHALNVAQASKATFRIHSKDLPVFDGVLELAEVAAGGAAKRNRSWADPHCTLSESIDAARAALLFDAQTSGPLLIAVPEPNLSALRSECLDRGAPEFSVIGEVIDGAAGTILVD
jgi:selenide, water dikinase